MIVLLFAIRYQFHLVLGYIARPYLFFEHGSGRVELHSQAMQDLVNGNNNEPGALILFGRMRLQITHQEYVEFYHRKSSFHFNASCVIVIVVFLPMCRFLTWVILSQGLDLEQGNALCDTLQIGPDDRSLKHFGEGGKWGALPIARPPTPYATPSNTTVQHEDSQVP